jgi:excisionase family DNA binding protein
MYVSLGEAARRTGLSKATVQRAIKSGKLSAASVKPDGSYNIDPAELARVYELNPRDGFADPSMKQLETITETGGLQVELAVLRERMAAIGREREESERRYQLAADQIEDLRRRLDVEGEERRKLTALLTDQRDKPPADPLPQPKGLRGWLHRLTG